MGHFNRVGFCVSVLTASCIWTQAALTAEPVYGSYDPAPFSQRIDDFATLFAASCIATDADPAEIEPLSDAGSIWSAAAELSEDDASFVNRERRSWGMPTKAPVYVLAFGPSEEEGNRELECSLATPGTADTPHEAKAEIERLLEVLARQFVVQRTESVVLRGPGLEDGRITEDATVVLTDLEAPGRGDQKLEHSWSGGWHLLTLYRPVRKGWWWE